MSKIRFVGLDVHADTIAVSVAEPDGEVRPLGVIPNRLESIRKLVAKLGPAKNLRVCYEAGPTGYVVYWQLTALGVACEVVAPTLVPVKAGDRVKTDRRDARKLARSYRAGDLTPVWVPDAAHEALRDLVRAREDARQDQHRARHRLSKFLLRHGRRPPEDVKKHWTLKYMTWIKEQVHFDQPALEITTAGLRSRSRTYGRADSALGEIHCRSDPKGPAGNAGCDRSSASLARRCSTHRRNRGRRTRLVVAFPQSAAIDGLQRSGLKRVFQRQ
jgi:hypothetical protein